MSLAANDPTNNVFSITGSDLANTNTLSISGSASTSVLINISGQSDSFASMGIFLSGGITPDRIFYNFYEATSLSVHDIQIEGTVLAPLADLNFPHGLIEGQVVANSSNGAGQFNNLPFSGCLPVEHSLAFSADGSMDSTDNYQTGGTQYELYGMGVRQIGDYVIIAMNGNLPPAGVDEDGSHIGWGDLLMNFSPDLSTWANDVVANTYGVHFEANGSSLTQLGLYSNVNASADETSHSGWPTWSSYISWVLSQGQTVTLGNVPLSYLPQNSPVPNIIGSGNLLNSSQFQMLSSVDLESLGIDFPQAFNVPAANLGSQTIGFIFKRPAGMQGPYILHVAPDCANDSMGIDYRLE